MKYFYLALMILSAYGQAEAKEMPTVFDTPLNKEIIPVSGDSRNPNSISKISCFYYPQFMIKEVDMGEKGAEKLSVTPITPNNSPACTKDNAGEIEIKDWAGYFAGVKGEYVFFDSDDGYNGGVPFAVFSGNDAKKLFEDSSDDGTKTLHYIIASKDGLTIGYRRTLVTSCSLYQGNNTCWDIIKKETGITDSAPDCDKIYELEKKRVPKYSKAIAESPSVIGYEAELTYNQDAPTITAISGKVSCWLPD